MDFDYFIQKRVLLTATLGLMLSFFSSAQVVVSGVVRSLNGDRLGLSTVYLKYSSKGVVTNSNGEFNFNIDSIKMSYDTLVISHLGYYKAIVPLSSFLQRPFQEVVLEEQVSLLDQVTVQSSKVILKPEEIVSNAIKALPINNATDAYMLRGFYRRTNFHENSCVRLLEAAITTYEPPFFSDDLPLFDIEELRLSLDNRKAEYNPLLNNIFYGKSTLGQELDTKNIAMAGKNGGFKEVREATTDQLKYWESKSGHAQFYYFYHKNIIKKRKRTESRPSIIGHPALDENFLKMHKFKLDSGSFIDGEPVYVVKILPSNKSYQVIGRSYIPVGKIYIRMADFAVVQIEYNYILNPKISGYEKLYLISAHGVEWFKIFVKYREHEGRMYLAYLKNWEKDHIAYRHVGESKKIEGRSHYYVQDEYMINEIITDSKQLLIAMDTKPWNDSIYTFSKPYNSFFWQEYPVLKETTAQEKCRVDLEQNISLEDQFEAVKKR